MICLANSHPCLMWLVSGTNFLSKDVPFQHKMNIFFCFGELLNIYLTLYIATWKLDKNVYKIYTIPSRKLDIFITKKRGNKNYILCLAVTLNKDTNYYTDLLQFLFSL